MVQARLIAADSELRAFVVEALVIPMARYKVLKGVAHNIGHSFISLMNYAGDDYVMGHILRFARLTGRDTLTMDFVKREAGPPELLAEPISEVPARYMDWFWNLVERHGADRSFVKTATLTLRYDIATQRPHHSAPQLIESPFVCDVQITDTRGKDYAAHFDGWWYPERLENSKTETRPWWKFWVPRASMN
ncbi:MAG: hypothetical protein WAJ92_00065 [Candidatus Acidiferrales bacterium]